MAANIDFAALKERISIQQAADFLDLKLRQSGEQLRGACPACQSGGDRALAITPAKQLFFCFNAREGGDQLALVAHVNGVSVRQAAEALVAQFGAGDTAPQQRPQPPRDGLQALDYLEHDHPAVVAVGFEPAVAEALGVGWAPKGMMKGTVAVPVRLPDGTLVGYIGVTEARLPSQWHGIETNVVRLPSKTA